MSATSTTSNDSETKAEFVVVSLSQSLDSLRSALVSLDTSTGFLFVFVFFVVLSFFLLAQSFVSASKALELLSNNMEILGGTLLKRPSTVSDKCGSACAGMSTCLSAAASTLETLGEQMYNISESTEEREKPAPFLKIQSSVRKYISD